MILALDVSTVKVGIAILDKDENILLSDVIELSNKESLESRAQFVKEYISGLRGAYDIENIVIEEPFISITGGSGNAKTTSMLLTINGMVRILMYSYFNKLATMVGVRTCRKELGITIPKGLNQRQKKQVVIDYIKNYYSTKPTKFEYSLTKNGNYSKGVDDRADAIVLALCEVKRRNRGN
ncbi:MAG: hypothetical protein H7831_15260 [Magnetococcus sp. WYHC-3]